MATDYISRKEALEAAWHNYYPSIDHYCVSVKCATRKDLEKIPAADVRPVVLCRDCKHFNPYPGDCIDGGIEGVCKRHNSIGVLVMDDDFCSDAERI